LLPMSILHSLNNCLPHMSFVHTHQNMEG
jgi:hypothetical protein